MIQIPQEAALWFVTVIGKTFAVVIGSLLVYLLTMFVRFGSDLNNETELSVMGVIATVAMFVLLWWCEVIVFV